MKNRAGIVSRGKGRGQKDIQVKKAAEEKQTKKVE
jgi:hypothetical protein